MFELLIRGEYTDLLLGAGQDVELLSTSRRLDFDVVNPTIFEEYAFFYICLEPRQRTILIFVLLS